MPVKENPLAFGAVVPMVISPKIGTRDGGLPSRRTIPPELVATRARGRTLEQRGATARQQRQVMPGFNGHSSYGNR